jgi:hypothetical protein
MRIGFAALHRNMQGCGSLFPPDHRRRKCCNCATINIISKQGLRNTTELKTQGRKLDIESGDSS